MAHDRLIFRVHAIERMFQRGITEADVHDVLRSGEVIENYPNDTPYPSRLILGYQGARPIHVVAADSQEETIVITVYEPDPVRWGASFRRRKGS